MKAARTSISDEEASNILLSTANEGGSGLYEAVWEFNAKFPRATLSEKYRAAAGAICSLYKRGLIRLYREHLSQSGNSRFETFQPSEVDELLENPVTWYPEYCGVQIGFSATPAGETSPVTTSSTIAPTWCNTRTSR